MKKIIWIVAISLFLLNTPKVLACTCVEPASPQEELTKATAVFSGRVINIDTPGPRPDGSISTGDPVEYTFGVSEVWKGPKSENITVTTARSEVTCGYEFKEDEEYLVYAYTYGDNETLKTGICTRTKEVASAQVDMLELGGGEEVNGNTNTEPADSPNIFQVIWIWITSLLR